MSGWTSGNATEDGALYRGWFMGPYVEDELLSTSGVEAKWSVHETGELVGSSGHGPMGDSAAATGCAGRI